MTDKQTLLSDERITHIANLHYKNMDDNKYIQSAIKQALSEQEPLILARVADWLETEGDGYAPDPRDSIVSHKEAYIRSANQLRSMNKLDDGWISVETDLPDNGVRCLTYGEVEGYRLIIKGTVNTVGNGFPCGVTHWRPLPPPPSEER